MNVFPSIHMVFDFLAVVLSIAAGWIVYRWRFQSALEETAASIDHRYFLFLSFGSIVGSFLFGTLNLYLSGLPQIGRSILGALCGATFTVELYKHFKGVKNSTGYIYIVPFCICIAVGRIGCLLSGLSDNTYGIATDLPWGWDFGDHISRHPVPLYESLSMLLFLAATIAALAYRKDLVIAYGYYWCVGFYALQRMAWEFLKPYHAVIGGLNLFQILCLFLMVYSIVMIGKVRNARRIA